MNNKLSFLKINYIDVLLTKSVVTKSFWFPPEMFYLDYVDEVVKNNTIWKIISIKYILFGAKLQSVI